MATLKLKKPAQRAGNRPPVRGGTKRPTLSQAQTERERRRNEGFSRDERPREDERRDRGAAPQRLDRAPGRPGEGPPRRRDDAAEPRRSPAGDRTSRPRREDAPYGRDAGARPPRDARRERPDGPPLRHDERPRRGPGDAMGRNRPDRPDRPTEAWGGPRTERPRDPRAPDPRHRGEQDARGGRDARGPRGRDDDLPRPRGPREQRPGPAPQRPRARQIEPHGHEPHRPREDSHPRPAPHAGGPGSHARDDRDAWPPRPRNPHGPSARQDRPRPDNRPDNRPAPARRGRPDEAAGPRGAPKQRTEPGTGVRLSKRLGEMGVASRREADDWISAGWVRVDGRLAILGQRVAPDAKIEIDPAAKQHQAQRMTILLNKPIGYVSGQAEDGYEPAVVLVRPENRWADDPSQVKFHPGHLRGLAPAGRLDIDSTGLLVLTQDGRVARELIGEDSNVEKEYLVRVAIVGAQADAGHPKDVLGEEKLALLNHGLELDEVPLKPAKVSWQNEDQLRFVLREGKKRQIRRMCEAVGLQVLGLKRVRIGSIPLAALPAGQWRYLAPWERFR